MSARAIIIGSHLLIMSLRVFIVKTLGLHRGKFGVSCASKLEKQVEYKRPFCLNG